jgi:hypothetical protein
MTKSELLAYLENSVLPLSETRRVCARDATCEHLIEWAIYEDDEGTLAYIKSRLDLWVSHPECKTLPELEAKLDGY